MKKPLTICLMLLFWFTTAAQSKQRKLGPALNNPTFNYWAPFISLDGNTILFLGDYTEDNKPAPFIALRTGVDWKEPVIIPKKIIALNFTKGATLSADGKIMYVASSRGGTLGGFDILSSNISGTAFSDTQSIGAPINSPANEASPTFSLDGNTIYFMRCGKMTFDGASECKIMMATKKYGQWGKPVELPASINAGNSQMPRILADGITLLFSSNKHLPNQGGMDFYISRWTDGQWAAPINLEFANTPKDDIYGSVSSLGLNLLRDSPSPRKSELVEYLFPLELKPKSVIKIVGVVDGLPDLTKAAITLVNLESKKPLINLNPDAKGNFICYIPDGSLYGLFVEAPNENFNYFLKRYDLATGQKLPVIDRVTASLKPLAKGDQVELSGVSFMSFTSEINQKSIVELQKLSRVLKGNPTYNFNLDVSLFGLMTDSIQHDDFTEPMPDTVIYTKDFQVDSVTTESRDSLAIEIMYSNDRTQKQAQAVIDFLVKQGIKPEKLSISRSVKQEPIAEKRRTVIVLKAR